MFVDKLPIPQNGLDRLNKYSAQPTEYQEMEIADIVYQIYGLSSQEIEYIEDRGY